MLNRVLKVSIWSLRLMFIVLLIFCTLAVVLIQEILTPPFHMLIGTNQTSPVNVEIVFMVHFSSDVLRIQSLHKTWFQSKSPKVGLVALVPCCSSEYINQNIPTLQYKSNLKQCKKTMTMFQFALKTFPNAKYFVKSDDDTYVYQKNVLSYFESISKPDFFLGSTCGYHRGSTVGNLDKEYYAYIHYFCGGSYALTKNVMSKSVESYFNKSSSYSQLVHRYPGEDFCQYDDLGAAVVIYESFTSQYTELLVQSLHTLNEDPLTYLANREAFQVGVTSFHHLRPAMMLGLHQEDFLLGTADVYSLPLVVHYYFSHPNIEHCKHINPKWTFKEWNNVDQVKHYFWQLQQRSFNPYWISQVENPSFSIVLMLYGGMFFPNDLQCKEPLPTKMKTTKEAIAFSIKGLLLVREWSFMSFKIIQYFSDRPKLWNVTNFEWTYDQWRIMGNFSDSFDSLAQVVDGDYFELKN